MVRDCYDAGGRGGAVLRGSCGGGGRGRGDDDASSPSTSRSQRRREREHGMSRAQVVVSEPGGFAHGGGGGMIANNEPAGGALFRNVDACMLVYDAT